MKFPFLFSLSSAFFFPRPAPKPPTVSQAGIQARAIRHLIAHGIIDARTVLKMGTNDAAKMFSRMRDMGLLFAHDDACGHTWVKNASGHGKHKVHKWTNKLPPGWDSPDRRESPRKDKR